MANKSCVGRVENDGPCQAQCSCGYFGEQKDRYIYAAMDMRSHLANEVREELRPAYEVAADG